MKHLIISFILIGSILSCKCQKAPVKFGRIEKSEFSSLIYEIDTTAPAVVLCEYGYLDGRTLSFTHIIRVKILKESGLGYANWKFITNEKCTVRGKTYNLVNGEIVKEKLSSNNIYHKKLFSSYYVTSIAFPDAKVGSVFDLELSYPSIPREWYFQRNIPVIHSELIIGENEYIRFRKNFFGHEFLTSSEDDRYVAENMPAFKPEPYISSAENVITKFEFDILDILIPGYFYKAYTRSWEHLSKHLEDHDYFGHVQYLPPSMKKKIKEMESQAVTPKEKMILAYETIQKYHFNGWHYLYTSDQSLRPVIDKQEGNSADLNLLLHAILRKMNIDVDLIALSTRENGLLSPIYPSMERLNNVILRVNLEDGVYFLDPTDHYAPYSYLPIKDLNGRGRLISSDSSGWVDLNPLVKDKTNVLLSVNLMEDGTFNGTKIAQYEGYGAYNKRLDYFTHDNESDYLKSLSNKYNGTTIDEFSIENIEDNSKSVKEKFCVEITDKSIDLGNEIYIYPFLCDQLLNSPYNASERKYPVDYIYQREKQMTISIQIPDGWTVVEMPESRNMGLQGNAASVICQFANFGNTLNVTYRLMINQIQYSIEEYPDLKTFYEELVKLHSQPVLIKKAQ